MSPFNGLTNEELSELKKGLLEIFAQRSCNYSETTDALTKLAAATAGEALVNLHKISKKGGPGE